MKRLITSFVDSTEKHRKAIPTSVYNQNIRADKNAKIAALRSILKGIGCVRSSFNLRIETNTCKNLKVMAKFDCLTGAQFYLLTQIAPTFAFR